MPNYPVTSLDDPRLALYRNVKDSELAREGDRFVAEGHFVVQRLLASGFPVESVLLAERQLELMRPIIPETAPIYVASNAMLNQILGFQFHTGVIAIARRKPLYMLEQVLKPGASPLTLVILPDLTGLQNMGSIIRVSAAFGVDAIILGPQCADPFYRLSVRVSMGTVFKVPIIRSMDLETDLASLHDEYGVELAATVLDESAEDLSHTTRPARLGLLFGGEGYGLSEQVISLCQRKLTLPMRMGTDSLNVGVSAAVFLYHFTHVAPPVS
jgi:tRNA G18 (ribose-2'-O)-methylase SpoU